MKQILIVLFVLLSLVFRLPGQTSTMIQPTEGADAVAVTQQIVQIKFDGVIDSSSVLEYVPVNDTVIANKGSIYIVRRDLYDSLSATPSAQERASLYGDLSIQSDSVLQLTLDGDQLQYNREYIVFVRGLRVVDISSNPNDTVNVSDTTFTFTTAYGLHHVLGYSIMNKSVIHCGDTITVAWNQPLSGTSTGAGPLAIVEKYVSYSNVDSATIVWSFSSISSNLSLNNDSTELRIVPSGLDDSSRYRMTIFPSRINGDTNEVVTADFRLLSRGELSFSGKNLNPTDTVPAEIALLVGAKSSGSVVVDDTTKLIAPPTYNDLYFDHWECVEDPTLHMSPSPYIAKVYTCADVTNLTVTAVYGRRTKDTVAVSVSGTSYGSVSVHGFVDSLGAGEYTVYRGSDQYLIINAESGASGVFTGWTATGLPFHGSLDPIVVYNPGSNYRIIGEKKVVGGGFAPETCDAPPYSIDVFAHGGVFNIEPRRTPQWPADVATINPGLVQWSPYKEGVQLRQNNPFTQTVEVAITNSCYTIQCIKVDGQVVAGSVGGQPYGDYWTDDITADGPDDCYRSVDIFFVHKTYKLRSEVASIDASVVDVNIQKIIRSPIGYELLGWTRVDIDEWYRIDEYKCSTEVTCTPVTVVQNNVGRYREEVGWEVASPYTSDVLDQPTQILTFTMDVDRQVRYKWKESAFLATEIGFYSYAPIDDDMSDGVNWRWYEIDEDGVVKDEEESISYIYSEFQSSAPNATIFVKIRFNKKVDPSTINGNVVAEDGMRDDWQKLHKYEDAYLSANNEVTLKFISSDGVSIWCLGKHLIEWKAGLKNLAQPGIASVNLSNDGSIESQAAPPAVAVEFDEITVLRDDVFGCFLWWCESPDPELTTWAGIGSKTPRALLLLPAVSDDITKGNFEDMDENETNLLGYDQGTFTPWSRDGLMFIEADAVDSDDGYATTATLLSSTASALSAAGGTTVIGWAATIGGILADFAAAKLRDDAEPDAMGTLNPKGTLNYSTNLWGGKNFDNESLTRQWEMKNSNYRVKFTITLTTRN